MKLSEILSKLTLAEQDKVKQVIKAFDSGYGLNQIIATIGWSDIKKAILASHKASNAADVKIKSIKLVDSHTQTSGDKKEVWSSLNYECEIDTSKSKNQWVKNMRVTVRINSDAKGITIDVQTRYNQM